MDVLQIDQNLTLAINSFNSPFFDTFFWHFTHLSTWTPLLICLLGIVACQYRRQSVVVIIAIALAVLFADQISSSLIKPMVCRLRPTHEPDIQWMVHTVNDYRGGYYGFVSSHAANAFAVLTLTALVFRRFLYILALGIWSFFTSYSRIYLGVHYLGDILCGAIIGILVGLSIFHLIRCLAKRSAFFRIPTLKNIGNNLIISMFVLEVATLCVISAFG